MPSNITPAWSPKKKPTIIQTIKSKLFTASRYIRREFSARNLRVALVIAISLPLLSASITYAVTVFLPSQGGTGTGATPTYGQVLMGNGSGVYTPVSTSSLGITSGSSGSSGSSFSTTSASYFSSLGLAFSTTSTDYWKTQNTFESLTAGDGLTRTADDFDCDTATASSIGCIGTIDWAAFNSRLSTTTLALFDKGYFFSTTSTDYWLTQQSISSFSTTSALYFSSVGLAFSTTSTNYWLTQQALAGGGTGAATTSFAATYPVVIAANSSAITYSLAFGTTTANTFALTQTFTLAPIFSSLTGVLKGNGASAVTVAADGTDFSLIDVSTCAAGLGHVAVTAAGVFTCGNAFSTTSASYFASVGLAFSTTSTDYWKTQRIIGNVSTSTAESRGQLAAWSTTNGSPAQLYSVATTSGTVSSPLTGSLTCIGSCTLGIQNAVADGSTKGAASFVANDFDATSGNIGIDYTNGQAATGALKGFLTSADWTSFNSRLSTTTAGILAGQGLFHSTTSVAYQLTQPVILGNATSTTFFATLASSTSQYANNATTTNLQIRGLLTFNGVTGSTWAAFCTTITGSAALCDGDDASGGGGGGGVWPFTTTDTNFGVAVQSTTTPEWFKSALHASSTSRFESATIFGNFGIGTSTAWGRFSIMEGDTPFTQPLIAIGTNSSIYMMLSASSTAPVTGARFSVGTSSLPMTGIGEHWTATFNGPIYRTYSEIVCDNPVSLSGLTADSAITSTCGDFLFDEVNAGATNSNSDLFFTMNGKGFVELWAGATAANTALAAGGDGAAINPQTANGLLFNASSSPTFEAWIGASTTNATGTVFIAGFIQQTTGTSPNPGGGGMTLPGYYFFATSSPSGNWHAIARDNTGNAVMTNTGIASTSAVMRKMRVNVVPTATQTIAYYFIDDVLVAQNTVSVSGVRARFNPRITLAATGAGLAKVMLFGGVRVWSNYVAN